MSSIYSAPRPNPFIATVFIALIVIAVNGKLGDWVLDPIAENFEEATTRWISEYRSGFDKEKA